LSDSLVVKASILKYFIGKSPQEEDEINRNEIRQVEKKNKIIV
jgi:hypothetical protein